MCCVLKNLSSHLSHIKRMQMAELGWRKHTHPHTEGHISLKQPWTQREGAVPGGSVRGEPSCCPGSRSHLPPRPHIQRGRKGKRLNERRRKENKSVWTWDLSLRISFYSAFLCFPRQVWTCWLESFTRRKSNPKTHPTTSPLSPFGTVESEVDAKSCCNKVPPKCLITAFYLLTDAWISQSGIHSLNQHSDRRWGWKSINPPRKYNNNKKKCLNSQSSFQNMRQ